MNRKTATALGSVAFLVALGFGPVPDAGAQLTPPPTVPCPGCGPSGSTVPGADRAYAWPDHHCLPDGTSAYSVTFGLGANSAGPATFYARFTDGPTPDLVLGTLQPGQRDTYYPLVIVKPGQTINVDVIARRNGVPIQFGDGTVMREFALTCPCDQPPTTTTSTPSSPPPTVTGSSVPPGKTPTPSVSAPGGTTPPNQPGQLPATGATTPEVAVVGVLGLAAGLGLLLVAKRRNGEA
jgi:LPXTG-motif cell wall-anchored protein